MKRGGERDAAIAKVKEIHDWLCEQSWRKSAYPNDPHVPICRELRIHEFLEASS